MSAKRKMARTTASPVSVILAQLTPTARKILDAARNVAERDGYIGFTLRRIAEEAGVPKSLVIYHFENKAKLVALVVDWTTHEIDMQYVTSMDNLASDARDLRVDVLAGRHERIASNISLNRTYYNLLPYIVRTPAVRKQVAGFYDGYRAVAAMHLEGVREKRDMPAVAALLVAIHKGMGLQFMVDQTIDLAAAFALLKDVMKSSPLASYTSCKHDGGDHHSLSGARVLRKADTLMSVNPPLTDPLLNVSAPMKDILNGAYALLRRRGLSALTFEAVTAECGAPRSSVTYYFGDKQRFLAGLLDLLVYRQCREVTKHLRAMPAEVDPVRGLVNLQRSILGASASLSVFFNMFDPALMEIAARQRQLLFFKWLRNVFAQFLADASGGQEGDLAGVLATLAVAVTYGLGVQLLLDPEFDIASPLTVWRSILVER